MEIYWGLKKNEGVFFNRKDSPIEAIVRDIKGTRRTREATYEIRGVPGKTSVDLKNDDIPVILAEGVLFSIGHWSRGGKVETHIITDYPIEIKNYSE